MNEQISPSGNDFNPIATKKPRSWRIVFIAVGVLILVVLLFFIYLVFFSPDARRDFEAQKNYNQAIKAINTYEEAMQNDTYGGKTPQETLNLFIDALEKEDIELASKYFILRNDGSPDVQWLEGLKRVKGENKIESIVSDLKRAKITEGNTNLETAWFSIFDNTGEIIKEILLKFNKYSGIWKIENL